MKIVIMAIALAIATSAWGTPCNQGTTLLPCTPYPLAPKALGLPSAPYEAGSVLTALPTPTTETFGVFDGNTEVVECGREQGEFVGCVAKNHASLDQIMSTMYKNIMAEQKLQDERFINFKAASMKVTDAYEVYLTDLKLQILLLEKQNKSLKKALKGAK